MEGILTGSEVRKKRARLRRLWVEVRTSQVSSVQKAVSWNCEKARDDLYFLYRQIYFISKKLSDLLHEARVFRYEARDILHEAHFLASRWVLAAGKEPPLSYPQTRCEEIPPAR
jgi:hypothetical protein